MSIRSRLVLLLVCLVAVLGLVATGLRVSHRNEAERIFLSVHEERGALLDRLLALSGQPLRNFANDYSQWDDMVDFVRHADPAWAEINIFPSLSNFNAHAAWVAGPDGTLIYGTNQPAGPAMLPPVLSAPGLLARMQKEKLLHFFHLSPAGLLELRIAAIVPSDDIHRESEPRGWFIAARRWDESHLLLFSNTLQSHVSFNSDSSPVPEGPHLIHLERILPAWDGRPVQTLQVDFESPLLAQSMAGNKEEASLFYGFGFFAILIVLFTLTRWVIHPLQQLTRSLETGEPGPLVELERGSDEFSHLARQTSQSFVQRDALRENEARLRQMMALHERLGRDLHDGIIQSIYAAGLGLESARNLMHRDLAAAEQRLASCQRMFNDTLWQVRHFIHVLEPETPQGLSPAQSLAALIATMQSLQSIPVAADIDQDLATRIRPSQEMHLLHMARELLSNALRHSAARQVKITLATHSDGLARLEVTDDGSGFDPAAIYPDGRGLANLAARARDLDARLEIDSAPGKGTRIAIWFRPLA